MGGEIQWAALETLVELTGVDDVELLVLGIVNIRDHFRQIREAEMQQQQQAHKR